MKFIVGMPHSGELQLFNWYTKNKIKVDFRKQPTMERECVAWYNKQISDEEVIGRLVRTRSNTIIEINPCFMLITKLLEETFPQAEIWYIYKNPLEYRTKGYFEGLIPPWQGKVEQKFGDNNHFLMLHN